MNEGHLQPSHVQERSRMRDKGKGKEGGVYIPAPREELMQQDKPEKI